MLLNIVVPWLWTTESFQLSFCSLFKHYVTWKKLLWLNEIQVKEKTNTSVKKETYLYKSQVFVKYYFIWTISLLNYTLYRCCLSSIFTVILLMLCFTPSVFLTIKLMFWKLKRFNFSHFFFFFQLCIFLSFRNFWVIVVSFRSRCKSMIE